MIFRISIFGDIFKFKSCSVQGLKWIKMHIVFRGVYRMVGFGKCILPQKPANLSIQRYPC